MLTQSFKVVTSSKLCFLEKLRERLHFLNSTQVVLVIFISKKACNNNKEREKNFHFVEDNLKNFQYFYLNAQLNIKT